MLLLKLGSPNLEEIWLIGITAAPLVALLFFVWLWRKQRPDPVRDDYVEYQDGPQRSSP